MPNTYPDALFISHGAPDLVLADTAAARFLKEFGANAAKPKAYVVASAHFEADQVLLSGDAAPEMIYDFGGFDRRLNAMVYAAPGLPSLASDMAQALMEAGYDAQAIENRGFDHGTWVPMMLLNEAADVPIVQISVAPNRDARWHFELGKTLRAALSDNIAIIGSGSFTHNLRAVFGANGLADRNAIAPAWVTEFENWMSERLESGDIEALLDYRNQAPYAEENHPTEEHIAPLFVALGAGRSGKAVMLHESHEFGALAMNAFAFN
ncbi:class III extradiol ring-cleavage dioxygenase [Ahrensia kielensis]|uniref:Class III extradiol ring-cleavage dioxygenase n=1 Tax=Ahrensia kielensis TaxID=76980 RepID=A0ABU9T550_9HYPH